MASETTAVDQERAALLERAQLIQKAQEIQNSQEIPTDTDEYRAAVYSPVMTAINKFENNALFQHAPGAHATVNAAIDRVTGETDDYDDRRQKLKTYYEKMFADQVKNNPKADWVGAGSEFAANYLSPGGWAKMGLEKVAPKALPTLAKYMSNAGAARKTFSAVVPGTEKVLDLGAKYATKMAVPAARGAVNGYLANPGEYPNLEEETNARWDNAKMGAGMGVALGAGGEAIKATGKGLYNYGISPIVKAVDGKLMEPIDDILRNNRITGGLKSMADQLQTKFTQAGEVVGDIMSQATKAGAKPNHRGFAARLKSAVPTTDDMPMAKDQIEAVNGLIDDTVGNFKSQSYQKAMPKYKQEYGEYVSKLRDFFASQTWPGKLKLMAQGKSINQVRPTRPVRPANNMSMAGANDVRSNLGFLQSTGVSTQAQSKNIPIRKEIIKPIYPEARNYINELIQASLGKGVMPKFKDSNETYSKLKPAMDTITKVGVGEGGIKSLKDIMYAAPVTTRLGDFMANSDYNRYLNIPKYLVRNKDER